MMLPLSPDATQALSWANRPDARPACIADHFISSAAACRMPLSKVASFIALLPANSAR
jgi:hypothetical protein